RIYGYLSQVGSLSLEPVEPAFAYQNPFFCADPARIAELEELIWKVRGAGDSIGARVTVVASGVPAGLGEPVFDRLDADIAHALMSINAVKAVEIGAGTRAAAQRGGHARHRAHGPLPAPARAERGREVSDTGYRRGLARLIGRRLERMGRQFAVAVIGATGLIGETLITVLEERGFPVSQLYALASNRSLGRSASFRGRSYPVQELADFDFTHCDLALFCAGAQVSREYAPRAVAAGCLVIDNTCEFRYREDVPLVVPEVNL